jgi:hypothetical protein
MKKLVAFAMILSLGMFCAVGCNKPAPKKDKDAAKPAAAAEKDKAPAKEAAAPADKPADAPAAPAEEKPAEK